MSKLQFQAELESYRAHMDIERIKVQLYHAAGLQENTRRIDVGVNVDESKIKATKFATTVSLDDGTRLTVSMNMADASRINAEQANSMFWQIPCKTEGNAVPRTLAQVQECKCLVCQAACATILKWRMMK